MDKRKKSKNTVGLGVFVADFIIGFIFLVAILLFVVVEWSVDTYGVGLDEIIYTLATPIKGTDSGVVDAALKECIPKCFKLIIPYLMFWVVDLEVKQKIAPSVTLFKKKRKINIRVAIRGILFVCSAFALYISLRFANEQYGIMEYVEAKTQQTTIYETYYVDPNLVSIESNDGSGRNLILIYLESMENTYLSTELGGNQEKNLIPKLTDLANEQVSFSHTDTVGGFRKFVGATWTMGALFSSASGIPFSFPIEGNDAGKYENFASGVTTLGDILEEKGYVQEFMCGSDASYAGRSNFYIQHGDFKIFDLYTAREKGYISDDYYVWWGFQDRLLYEYAKDELLELSKGDAPFNLTMITVDTHFPGGYFCEVCKMEHNTIAKNVVSCADTLAYEFVEWCKEQEFYENTTIVILGDHPRMDEELVEGVKGYDRTLYNCFINTDKDKADLQLYNREFAAIDLFPTIVSALGYEIEGDRLGLGTNMFSDKSTLLEEYGYEELEGELQKSSDYYIEKFQ